MVLIGLKKGSLQQECCKIISVGVDFKKTYSQHFSRGALRYTATEKEMVVSSYGGKALNHSIYVMPSLVFRV